FFLTQKRSPSRNSFFNLHNKQPKVFLFGFAFVEFVRVFLFVRLFWQRISKTTKKSDQTGRQTCRNKLEIGEKKRDDLESFLVNMWALWVWTRLPVLGLFLLASFSSVFVLCVFFLGLVSVVLCFFFP